MPTYNFRCNECRTEFDEFYKSTAAYDAATITCPQCGAENPARIIKRVTVAGTNRDYSRMNANEMLSVLESGNQQDVQQMYQQVGGTDPTQAAQAHETAKKLQAKSPPQKKASD